jgi:hypothetical protein
VRRQWDSDSNIAGEGRRAGRPNTKKQASDATVDSHTGSERVQRRGTVRKHQKSQSGTDVAASTASKQTCRLLIGCG